jgi:spore germination cell wall hydrolase CwlJ-like protein
MHEAGNTEPHEGIVALIACVANRARLRDGRFPNTVIGVGYQDGQMTCVTDGSIWRYTVNDRVEAAWQDFISGGYARHPKIVSWTAGHYNPYFEPAYPIGGHFFGY